MSSQQLDWAWPGVLQRKNSNQLMLGPHNPYMHRNVPHFRANRIFFILTLHTLRQSLDWPLTWALTSQPKHETCSDPSKKVRGNVGRFRPGNFFSILTLHTLRQLLDWPLISFSTSQPKHRTCSNPSKKISQNFTSSPITRKSLVTQILERSPTNSQITSHQNCQPFML